MEIASGLARTSTIQGSYGSPTPRRPARREDGPAMRDDSLVAALVARARDGDKDAWDAIVDRYAPLIWSICRRYRLARADADDVGQSVWLRLVDQLGQLREPEALPGWLATTTRRECGRLLTGSRRREALGSALDPADIPDGRGRSARRRAPRRTPGGVRGAGAALPGTGWPAHHGPAGPLR
jgi:hypothetical protein